MEILPKLNGYGATLRFDDGTEIEVSAEISFRLMEDKLQSSWCDFRRVMPQFDFGLVDAVGQSSFLEACPEEYRFITLREWNERQSIERSMLEVRLARAWLEDHRSQPVERLSDDEIAAIIEQVKEAIGDGF